MDTVNEYIVKLWHNISFFMNCCYEPNIYDDIEIPIGDINKTREQQYDKLIIEKIYQKESDEGSREERSMEEESREERSMEEELEEEIGKGESIEDEIGKGESIEDEIGEKIEEGTNMSEIDYVDDSNSSDSILDGLIFSIQSSKFDKQSEDDNMSYDDMSIDSDPDNDKYGEDSNDDDIFVEIKSDDSFGSK